MICNHCTILIPPLGRYWSTRNGFVCERCRDEIIAANARTNNDTPYPFCLQPQVCAGKGSCPRDPCCAD